MTKDKDTPKNDVTQTAEEGQDTFQTEEIVSAEISDSDEAEVLEEAVETDEPSVEDVMEESVEPEPTPEVAAPVEKTVEKVVVKRGGFVPALLGGVLCAGLGYAGAQFIKPQGWPFPGADTTELTQQIDVLTAEIAGLKSDLGAQKATLSEADTALRSEFDTKLSEIDVTAQVQPLADQIAGLESRLTSVEAAPVADAVVSPEATAAYERQLAQMQELLNSEIARLEQTKSEALAKEANAQAASAKTRLMDLVDAGDPFASALAETGLTVPDTVNAAAQTGVPSVTELQDSYPEAARAALLAASHAAYDAGEQSWLRTALQTQLGLRSTAPKEGEDADAILSRAEQSVRKGQFAEAIAALDALPEAGRAEMEPWIAQAKSRVDVMAALDTMFAQ